MRALVALVGAMSVQGLALAEDSGEPTGNSPTLPTVTVTGEEVESPRGPDIGYEAKRSLTATKTATPISEIPRSISVVTRKRMEDQNVQSLGDVLGYVPGIYSPPFAGGDLAAGDYFFIRGFNATDFGYGLYRDGLRLQGNRYDTSTEPFGLERVEVFRGPTSILYGENAPGGLVNLVSKRPTAAPSGEIMLSYGSFDRKQVGVDLSGPLTSGGNVLGRVVLLGRDSNTQIKHMPDDRLYIAPSLTVKFGDATSLTLLASYQHDNTKIELGLPAAGTVLKNPYGQLDNDTLLGNPDWDEFKRDVWTLGYQFDHLFNETWQFRQNARYLHSQLDRHEFWPGQLDEGGFGRTLINNTVYDRFNKSITMSVDNQLEAQFSGGGFENTLLLGASFDRTEFNQDMDAGAAQNIDIFNPVWTAEPQTPLVLQRAQLQQEMYGLYSQLQSKYNHWIFLVGGRWDWVNSHYETEQTPTNPVAGKLDYWDDAFTWQTGLMYEFASGLSPYLSYSTAFVPVQQITKQNKEPFEPIESKQYEIGLKYTPPGLNTSVTLSVFDLRMENDVIFTGNTYRQVGESRSRGAELELVSDLSESLSLLANYTYIDASITEDGGSGREDRQKTGIPRNTASAWLNYRVPKGILAGLQVGGGVRYIGSTNAYTALYGRVKTNDATLVDANVGYNLDNWSLDLSAKNLLDKEYVANCLNSGRCNFGQERTLMATLRYHW